MIGFRCLLKAGREDAGIPGSGLFLDMMKNPALNFGKILLATIAGSASLAFPQTLPENIAVETFYNTSKVNLRADSVKAVSIAEVPGLPKHLYVLDLKGKLWGVFPDTTGYTGMQWYNYTGTNYRKALLANFSAETHYSAEGEAGAYSICFHPQFAKNRKFYVFYYKNNPAWAASLPIPNPAPNNLNPAPTPFHGEDDFGNPAGDLVLDEYQVDSNDVSKVTRVRPGVFTYHHQPSIGQGNAKFGPDGYLYLAISDFDGSGRDLHTLARKILRIDVTTPPPPGAAYVIPPDNPYVSDPDTAIKREIWAVGFRAPWSMAFDSETGDHWVGDVDQSTYEEINLIKKKGNYGWDKGGDLSINGNQGNSFSGPCATAASPNIKPSDCAPFTDPSFIFTRSGATAMSCVIVGTVFRGAATSPFYGALLSADNSSNKIVATRKGAAAQPVGNAAAQFGVAGHRGIAAMASGAGGVVYVVATDWYDPANRAYRGAATFYEVYRLTSPDLTPKSYSEVTALEKRDAARMNPARAKLMVDLGFSPAKNPMGSVYDLSGKSLRGLRGTGIYCVKPGRP